MSTISISTLIATPRLRKERGFNSLFASYANTQRKPCGRCRKQSSMVTCKTLLNSLIKQKKDLIVELFKVPPGSTLTVYCQKDNFGIRIE